MVLTTRSRILITIIGVSVVACFVLYSEYSKIRRESQAILAIQTLLSVYDGASFRLDTRQKTTACVVHDGLPDHACTPGAVFPDATCEVICISGYTKTVRATSVTLKQKVYKEYGVPYPQKRGTYEADHLIPLELGGNNDIANLFPEAARPTPGFPEKDVVENYLHEEVCAGHIDLGAAQMQIADNWRAVYSRLTPEQIQALKQKYSNWSH